jgi:hypothetical protein
LRDRPFDKTHLLPSLLDACVLSDPEFVTLRDHAEILSPYCTRFRYPGSALEPDAEDMQEALRLTREVLEFVLLRMPPEAL